MWLKNENTCLTIDFGELVNENFVVDRPFFVFVQMFEESVHLYFIEGSVHETQFIFELCHSKALVWVGVDETEKCWQSYVLLLHVGLQLVLNNTYTDFMGGETYVGWGPQSQPVVASFM